MNRRQAILALSAVCACGAAATPALACSCVYYRSAADHLRQIDLLFVGRPLSTTQQDGSLAATRFRVTRVLKGRRRALVTVAHPTEAAAGCGVVFTPGRSLLVAANLQAGRFTTSSCNMPRFSVAEYVAALRA